MTSVSLPLSRPIKVGNVEVSALVLDPEFRVGWLRGAPKTPGWLIAVLRSVLSDLEAGQEAAGADPSKLLAAVPMPSGEEVSEMIPWLLHMAGKASGQPDAVIDQLALPDLLQILMKLMPGMGALPHFPATPASGSATSPGSSGGARAP
ncbi:MAG: hypothetical protein K2Y40_12790 [Reyranella sp.]|nr:hypothetical protein [Reyranella sp.]